MLTPGQILKGKYRILRSLGGGSFGQTYLAEDVEMQNQYAIKQLKPFSNSAEILEIAKRLFDREAKTLKKLGNHNQIPELFDYFEENNEFYLVQ